MPEYQLTEKADLGVLFDLTRMEHSAEEWERITQGRVTRETFIRYCFDQGYDSIGFSFNGKPIGGLIFDGQTVHITVAPEHHGRWGVLWKRTLRWIFSHKDPIEVNIPAHNAKAVRFLERNNWARIREDEKFVTFHPSSKTLPLFLKSDKTV